ncbi:MAG TPA: hypothetical protein VEM40_04430 [Nitrospirota bacterium]|nr:hypothetical protein [Nitrospirota bacterium]
MAETLGSLCDKLTVVKLKQWHTEEPERVKSLLSQEKQLQDEINEYIAAAVSGQIQIERLTFAANKVFKKDGNVVSEVTGTIGAVFSKLAEVNCKLWHEQEKVYDFENVPVKDKDSVVKSLAHLNLERTQCIDQIDKQFRALIERFQGQMLSKSS